MTENNSKEYARELVRQAQGGDHGSLEKLRDIYFPLLQGSCARSFVDGMQSEDREELFAEALIAFCNAVSAYDLGLEGIEFGLYAKICIDNALISYRRAFERRSRLMSVPLDTLDASCDGQGEADPIGDMVAIENATVLARRISSQLSVYENRVWWLYVSGLSAREISIRVGADERSVHNAIYRIRRKLRRVISEDK